MTVENKGQYLPMKMKIGFVKCHPHAKLPTQAHKGEDIGFDLYAIGGRVIESGDTAKIPIGLKFANAPAPPEVSHLLTPFFKIEGRSGLACQGIFPIGGVVDLGYRGELNVVLHNASRTYFAINPGDKIAQLVCYLTFTNANGIAMHMYETDEVEGSARGSDGFGSTGK